ncbi:histidinol-phosphatase HisJ family protein [Desulfuribacillus alkaliarsenatis]|uniref:Histidinol-phosphatase n=1 Tax=Desulfuribacillus alkaliarsenatis TaxID=766136 RepID=A0A1E5G300_9FIRM|nr:histidinol-phosphatase HisJ family protein [Desulfuribacillus alkaliarsenatis]OEF97447.1 hypothetical protein BHF68_04350 [Desulfuribacillus alkaliarsenatis]
MFDYHVHTNFSADSSMHMEKACQAAIAKNIQEIAFTEHLDLFYPNCDLTWNLEYDNYAKEIDTMRAKYGNQLKILKAIEVGLHPSVYQESRQFTNDNQFDFIIGSVHLADDNDLHEGYFFKDKSLQQALEIYFLTINNCVKEYTDFNVLGHLTLIKRYLHYLESHWEDVNWEDYFDIIEDTFKTLIDTSRGIELNMSGFRYNLNCSLPTLPFLQLYRDLGGEIITVGSDAHCESYVGKNIALGYDLLTEAGFQYVTTFEKRQPIFNKL